MYLSFQGFCFSRCLSVIMQWKHMYKLFTIFTAPCYLSLMEKSLNLHVKGSEGIDMKNANIACHVLYPCALQFLTFSQWIIWLKLIVLIFILNMNFTKQWAFSKVILYIFDIYMPRKMIERLAPSKSPLIF